MVIIVSLVFGHPFSSEPRASCTGLFRLPILYCSFIALQLYITTFSISVCVSLSITFFVFLSLFYSGLLYHRWLPMLLTANVQTSISVGFTYNVLYSVHPKYLLFLFLIFLHFSTKYILQTWNCPLWYKTKLKTSIAVITYAVKTIRSAEYLQTISIIQKSNVNKPIFLINVCTKNDSVGENERNYGMNVVSHELWPSER